MQDNQLISLLAAIFYTRPSSVATQLELSTGQLEEEELLRRSFAKAVDFHSRGHTVVQALIAQMEAAQQQADQGHADA